MTEKWDRRFLDMAQLVAGWSKDPSTQTGAVIVAPDLRIISVGFNGFPRVMPDSVDLYANREEKYSRIVHCEMNAILHSRESLKGATLYTWPFMSCDRCAVHVLQAGITRLVAPRATGERALRWEEAFKKTRQYTQECSVELVEYNYA